MKKLLLNEWVIAGLFFAVVIGTFIVLKTTLGIDPGALALGK